MPTREQLETWISQQEHATGVFKRSPAARKQLADALYSFSELGLFEVGSVDVSEALRIWAVVEQVRAHGFPDHMRM